MTGVGSKKCNPLSPIQTTRVDANANDAGIELCGWTRFLRPDGVNTAGIALLGGTLLLVFVVSKIEAVTLGGRLTSALLSLAITAAAAALHIISARLPVAAVQYASIAQD